MHYNMYNGYKYISFNLKGKKMNNNTGMMYCNDTTELLHLNTTPKIISYKLSRIT